MSESRAESAAVPIWEVVEDNRLGNFRRFVFQPYGQPLMQVPDEIHKCVAFLGAKTKSGSIQPLGTVFFVGESIEGTNTGIVYAVTARHVVEAIRNQSIDNSTYFRLNTRTGLLLKN